MSLVRGTVLSMLVKFCAITPLLPILSLGADEGSSYQEREPIVLLTQEPGVDSYGPGSCVSISRLEKGTCQVTTNCSGYDVSNVELCFVCINPGAKVPFSLHSWGVGNFTLEDSFDSGVLCDACVSIRTAFSPGGPITQSALEDSSEPPSPHSDSSERIEQPFDEGDGGMAPVDSPARDSSSVQQEEYPEATIPDEWRMDTTTFWADPEYMPDDNEMDMKQRPPPKRNGVPTEDSSSTVAPTVVSLSTAAPTVGSLSTAAPSVTSSACIEAYRSQSGTCVVKVIAASGCINAKMGVKCTDELGNVSTYMFAEARIGPDETFDTRIQCEQCDAVSTRPAIEAVGAALPEQFAQDLMALKAEVAALRDQVRAIREAMKGAAPAASSERRPVETFVDEDDVVVVGDDADSVVVEPRPRGIGDKIYGGPPSAPKKVARRSSRAPAMIASKTRTAPSVSLNKVRWALNSLLEDTASASEKDVMSMASMSAQGHRIHPSFRVVRHDPSEKYRISDAMAPILAGK